MAKEHHEQQQQQRREWEEEYLMLKQRLWEEWEEERSVLKEEHTVQLGSLSSNLKSVRLSLQENMGALALMEQNDAMWRVGVSLTVAVMVALLYSFVVVGAVGLMKAMMMMTMVMAISAIVLLYMCPWLL